MAERLEISALLDDAPIIDVRSEGEYAKAAFPQSVNLPILNDKERHRVGLTYRDRGADAATALGHKLVAGKVREARIQDWAAFAKQNGRTRLMCWRGGQRSAIAAEWLEARGIAVDRIPGGYKALRRLALATLETTAQDAERRWWVLGGRTGSAKTRLIENLAHAIDLEGLAEHRGSAFGARSVTQPSVATFENRLAIAAARHATRTADGPLILEDESRTIGRVSVPEDWHRRMQSAPLLLIDADVDERIEHIRAEYVEQPLQQGAPAAQLAQKYLSASKRIARRLGGVRHQALVDLIQEAFEARGSHDDWIRYLLVEYYDPMYDYQIAKKAHRILFRGRYSAVSEFIAQEIRQTAEVP